jgi:hypothetical protein
MANRSAEAADRALARWLGARSDAGSRERATHYLAHELGGPVLGLSHVARGATHVSAPRASGVALGRYRLRRRASRRPMLRERPRPRPPQ